MVIDKIEFLFYNRYKLEQLFTSYREKEKIMNLSNSRSNPFSFVNRIKASPSVVLGFIIITALLAFEMFNYSTTDYALRDLLGNLKFLGIPWSTILAIAFCGIDFAGIARLFTPEQGADEPKEVWYLFGAWLLAATMNAVLTWWGVSMAIVSHSVQSTSVLPQATITKVVPAFVAIMVWVIRILIIGSLSVAGDRMIWGTRRRSTPVGRPLNQGGGLGQGLGSPVGNSQAMPRPSSMSARPAPRPMGGMEASSARPEPTYHSLSMNARPSTTETSSTNTKRF
jgi:hypothetical protein